METNELKEFLEWLTDETSYNIPNDEINEIVQDWNYYKGSLEDENNKSFDISAVIPSVCANKNHSFQIKWCGKCVECGQTDEVKHTEE